MVGLASEDFIGRVALALPRPQRIYFRCNTLQVCHEWRKCPLLGRRGRWWNARRSALGSNVSGNLAQRFAATVSLQLFEAGLGVAEKGGLDAPPGHDRGIKARPRPLL